MALKDEVLFLIGMRKKIVASGVPTTKINDLFMDICTSTEMSTIISKDALNIVFAMFDIVLHVKVEQDASNVKTKNKPTTVDPCSRGYSGSRTGGC
jgi:hypothetical protein